MGGRGVIFPGRVGSVLSFQHTASTAVLQMLSHQTETAPLRQTGIGMVMHGCVGLGWSIALQPVVASHALVTEQPVETEPLGNRDEAKKAIRVRLCLVPAALH
jgi:hypothetical protein